MLREALTPLVRELRQTLASFRAAAKADVDLVLVTGGTGRLKGLLPFLEAELGLPARFLAVRPALERAAPPGRRRRRADAGRRGPTSPSRTRSRPPSRSPPAAAARRSTSAAAPSSTAPASRSCARRLGTWRPWARRCCSPAGSTSARRSNLGTERKELDKQLKVATQELFGQPRDDAEAVTQLLRKGFREELAPLPKATAFDLLDQISRKVPPADKVKLDVAELDIRPKKTFIKGTVDSAAAVDEIAAKLKEIECFEEVTKGAITEVSGGGKQFTLNIASKCP